MTEYIAEKLEREPEALIDIGSAATASASTESVQTSGLSVGAKLGVVAFYFTAFPALATMGRRTVNWRRFAREMEDGEAEIDRANKNASIESALLASTRSILPPLPKPWDPVAVTA